jgi:nucleotide-binding universal stress UspA family protein
MGNEQGGEILVGIDGSQAGAYALDWAAEEAERRGARLVIAHAGDLPHRDVLTEDTARAAIREVCDFGRELLADAVATVVEDHADVDARTELREAAPAAMLLELSEKADLLVVGRGAGGPLARFVFGSTAQRVAGHARCPVVVVSGPATTGPVVVGVSGSAGGQRAMQAACTEAALRGTTVLALRSGAEVTLAAAGLGFGASIAFDSLRDGEQAILDNAVTAAREAFPGLQIEGRLTDTPPYLALEEAGRDASLLVVGSRRAEGTHLPIVGPLASWLLHHAPCPVAIVSQTPDPTPEEP